MCDDSYSQERIMKQLESEMKEIKSDISSLSYRVDVVEGTVTDIERRVDDVESDVSETISSKADSCDVSYLDDVVSDLRNDLDSLMIQLEEMRKLMRSCDSIVAMETAMKL